MHDFDEVSAVVASVNVGVMFVFASVLHEPVAFAAEHCDFGFWGSPCFWVFLQFFYSPIQAHFCLMNGVRLLSAYLE